MNIPNYQLIQKFGVSCHVNNTKCFNSRILNQFPALLSTTHGHTSSTGSRLNMVISPGAGTGKNRKGDCTEQNQWLCPTFYLYTPTAQLTSQHNTQHGDISSSMFRCINVTCHFSELLHLAIY